MAGDFRVVAPDQKVHGEQILDLLCKVFDNYSDRYAVTRDWLLNAGRGFYSFPASRIGLMDRKVVTHFGVFDYQMRVGRARLRTAGIGYVATQIDFRKRGLMEKTAQACVKGLREAGFDFSMLFGLRNFYHRFGYSRAWSESEYTATLEDLTLQAPPAKAATLTEFPFARRPDLERLFNKYHATHTGSAVRPTHPTWTLWGKPTAFSWNDARGRLAGYIAVHDRGARIDVVEAVGENEAVAGAVGFAAQKYSCDEIRFVRLPPQSPLARFLRRGTLTERIAHHKNANALGRLIHLPRALEKMAGEFSHRLHDAGLSGYRGELALSDGTDWATLLIDRGQVRVLPKRRRTGHVIQGGVEISQLIIGTDEPRETVRANAMRATGDAPFLVQALFPRQYPVLPGVDHF